MANHPETEKLIRRYFDAMRRKDYDAIWACYCDDIIYEDAALGHVYNGLAATKEFYLTYMSALDVTTEIETLVTTDAAFGIGHRFSGTHTKDLPGLPATGKPFSVRGATIGSIENRKIKSNIDYWNVADLMSQLGLGPSA
jgi:steroid delta-isomerase-like uncharacterized protein